MPHWSRSKLVVIHEVAHLLCGRYYGHDFIAGHGPEYVTLFPAMVPDFLGQADGLELQSALTRRGVERTILDGEWAAAG